MPIGFTLDKLSPAGGPLAFLAQYGQPERTGDVDCDPHYETRGSYHRLFARCGFSYQRPAKVHKSRSEAKIAEIEEQLEKRS